MEGPGSHVMMKGCELEDCTAAALVVRDSGTAQLANCVLNQNAVGVGVRGPDSSVEALACEIKGNDKGAVIVVGSATVQLKACELKGPSDQLLIKVEDAGSHCRADCCNPRC